MKLYIKGKLNHIPRLNDFLDARNQELGIGDQMDCVAFTYQQVFSSLKKRYPLGLGHLFVFLSYVWHVMTPKISLTQKFYLFLTRGRNRLYSHTEILGRLCRAGFKIVHEDIEAGHLHVVVEKKSDPLERNDSCDSPILRLPRRGKDGKMINVYKFRTMYSYSQYLQDYVYEMNKLNKSGKMTNDFRVNIWGKMFRPIWLDELPMLWNVVKGDMKWVGVRPLSEHFFSLYTPEMQELRTRVKPGMLPPFYYEKEAPNGLDEIQASERRYIEAYLAHPFRTDWKYFWGTLFNIFVKMKRSK